MTTQTHGNPFTPGLLDFLRELETNNRREWFENNKARYEEEVREPALEFIRGMTPRLANISKHLVANDAKVGGSLMRIFRDVRFSSDKRPYKTNLGIQFRHGAGKDVHAPGFYFHVEPRSVFLGAGLWRPEASVLAKIRAAIVADPKAFQKALAAKAFSEGFTLEGESLKKAPKGFDPDHSMVDHLRRKDHIAVLHLEPADVTRPDLADFVADRFASTKPFMAFLTQAIGLPF
jgi:uncharacterized protein (TIGR02453 family)